MPDAHGWQVGASALVAAVIIFFGVWLRAGTFAYFRVGEFRDHARVWRAFRHGLRHMVALAVWAVFMLAVELLLIPSSQVCAAVRRVVLAEVTVIPALRQPAAGFSRRRLAAVVPDLGAFACGVAAYRHHGCSRRIWIEADDALPARLAAARLLAVVLRADARRRVCSVQAGLVDTRSQRSEQTGMEHGLPIPVGLRDLDFGLGGLCCWSSERGWRRKILR
jgi:hypothetical protein